MFLEKFLSFLPAISNSHDHGLRVVTVFPHPSIFHDLVLFSNGDRPQVGKEIVSLALSHAIPFSVDDDPNEHRFELRSRLLASEI